MITFGPGDENRCPLCTRRDCGPIEQCPWKCNKKGCNQVYHHPGAEFHKSWNPWYPWWYWRVRIQNFVKYHWNQAVHQKLL